MTLAETIAPLSETEFIEQFLGINYLLVKNGQGFFSSVLTWQELNDALCSLRVYDKRLRLVQSGRSLDRAEFLALDGADGAYIDARRLTNRLAAGATLVVDKVDELFHGVRELAESCEELFRIRLGVNLYAGWRTDNAFDLHWDRHDTLILQIAGRKRWQVFEPTRLHPVDGDPAGDPPKPSGPPAWEGILEDGDLLYMPRGWWHVAYPMDESTLHLTFGLKHNTGFDLLEWVTRKLQKEVDFRTDLPHLQSAPAKTAYVERLRELVASALSDDVIDTFMRRVEEATPVRPRINLPDDVTRRPAPIAPGAQLRLMACKRLYFDTVGGSNKVTVKVGDRDATCDEALVPALQQLRQTRPCTMNEMLAATPPKHHLPLQALIFGMVEKGVISVDVAQA